MLGGTTSPSGINSTTTPSETTCPSGIGSKTTPREQQALVELVPQTPLGEQ
jgi:hypothetical protein